MSEDEDTHYYILSVLRHPNPEQQLSSAALEKPGRFFESHIMVHCEFACVPVLQLAAYDRPPSVGVTLCTFLVKCIHAL